MVLLAKMLADMLSIFNWVFICRRSGLFCTGFILNLYFVQTFKIYLVFCSDFQDISCFGI